jgi:hypothetical protein
MGGQVIVYGRWTIDHGRVKWWKDLSILKGFNTSKSCFNGEADNEVISEIQ